MNYGTFTSSQYAEVMYGDDYNELEFDITLRCVEPSIKVSRHEPADAAIFVIDCIYVNNKMDGFYHEISHDVFFTILGKEASRSMIENAEYEANESGEF